MIVAEIVGILAIIFLLLSHIENEAIERDRWEHRQQLRDETWAKIEQLNLASIHRRM